MPSDSGTQSPANASADHWFILVWMLVSVWIVACALLVQGEYGDGYQTIANARYFFGDSPNYYVQRGPLAALALWPVEMFVSWFDWNPLDVRPYHIYSGILHILYLPACWLLLKRTGHAPVAQLLAFLAAVLCVVFYAYAPYLSHDIIPGFLFLALIFLFHRWLNAADNKTALLLVLLGTAVTFIKQTYAIFWIALIVYASVAFILKWNEQRVTGRKILILFALAAVSGVISWLGYGLFIAKELPDVSILMRPLALINAVSTQYDADLSTLFAPDMYLRNAHNYGVAALLLIIPGLIYAFRAGDARLRMSAVCWLVCFVIMQFLSYREVRYLAFLAPLTAVLIAPIMQIVLKRRVLAGIVIAALVVDQSRGIALAAEQISSTTRINVIRFVDAPVGNGKIVSSETLSFVYMADSPLLRDPYHGIYHLTMEHMLNLHEGQLDILKLDDPRNLGLAGIEPGDRVYYSNNTIIRKAPWQENNVPPDLPQLLLVSGDAAAVELVRQDTEFAINSKEGGYVMLIPGPDRGPQMPLIAQASLSMEQTQSVYGDVDGLERLSVTGVIVRALCQADRCSYR